MVPYIGWEGDKDSGRDGRHKGKLETRTGAVRIIRGFCVEKGPLGGNTDDIPLLEAPLSPGIRRARRLGFDSRVKIARPNARMGRN